MRNETQPIEDAPVPTEVGVAGMSDEEVVERVREGDVALFEVIMRRYNERLYRTARAVLGSDDDTDDVVQQSYVSAFQHLAQFEGRSRFSTWLTRIVLNEAYSQGAQARAAGPGAMGLGGAHRRGALVAGTEPRSRSCPWRATWPARGRDRNASDAVSRRVRDAERRDVEHG